MSRQPRYEKIGAHYATRRGEDALIRERVHAALATSHTVVNIGAGPGSYEPTDKHVIAIEPSDVMASQRPPERVPAIRAFAGSLPLRDDSVDAAMTVMSLHHWDETQRQGVLEMRRVARGPVVIVTCDPAVCAQMWLYRDYFPELIAMDARIFPPLETLDAWLGGGSAIEVLPVPRTTADHNLLSFWAHPERVADPAARAATSGFSRQPEAVVSRVVDAVARDLQSGTWDERNGELRALDTYDVGMRLLVHHP